MMASRVLLCPPSFSLVTAVLRSASRASRMRSFSTIRLDPSLSALQSSRSRTFPRAIPRWTPMPIISVRFNSSTSSDKGTLTIDSATTDDAAESFVEAATMVNAEDAGHLSALGIQFGFGPSGLFQLILETIHSFTGAPWWATIALTVLIVRGTMFPLYCRMSSQAARMTEVNPLLVPLTKRMRALQLEGDKAGMIEVRREMSELLKKAGVNRLWLLFPISQVPIFYAFYRNLREMSNLPVPAFAHDGILWFQDMTAADPYYILPAISAGLIVLQLGIGGEAGATNIAKSMKKILMFVLPTMSLLVTHAWPSGLCFYVFCTTTFGVVQTFVIKQPWFREWAGMYPLNTSAPNPLPSRNTIQALNVARSALPKKAQPEINQIGGEGSLLDKITGGKDDEGSMWSIGNWREQAAERARISKHKSYEKRRQQRLEKEKRELELERERKRRLSK